MIFATVGNDADIYLWIGNYRSTKNPRWELPIIQSMWISSSFNRSKTLNTMPECCTWFGAKTRCNSSQILILWGHWRPWLLMGISCSYGSHILIPAMQGSKMVPSIHFSTRQHCPLRLFLTSSRESDWNPAQLSWSSSHSHKHEVSKPES